MKVLIIGYGSIGRRHHEVLLKSQIVKEIYLVTKQKIEEQISFKALEDISDLNVYDYFVIASETNKHFVQLHYLEERVVGKVILCEKPLFETKKALHVKNNSVFVGYVLRFHPLLQKLKVCLKDATILSANVMCGSYLPHWRTNIDYRDSYSAKKDQGGGVLLDLSHEIDYIQSLFGKVIALKSYQMKVSDLEIDSDDLVVAIGKTSKDTVINFSIDYISKIPHRKILVTTNDKSFELDFINNSLIQRDKFGVEEKYAIPELERNYMFECMHDSILSKGCLACTFDEGMEVMEVIASIQKDNNG